MSLSTLMSEADMLVALGCTSLADAEAVLEDFFS